jgi:hypothetical protein
MDSIETSKEIVANRLLKEAISMQRSDPEKAISLYGEIRKKYPGTRASELAQAYAYNLEHDDGTVPYDETQIVKPRNLTGWVIAIPFLALLLGFTIAAVVPGCKWDEGMGGHGCVLSPIDKVLDVLIMGGAIGFFGGLLFVAPITSIAYRIADKRYRKSVARRDNPDPLPQDTQD